MSSRAAQIPAPEIGDARRQLITGTIALGSIATILTSTVINVAIPSIMGAFGVGQDKAQWLTTGNLAAMTTSMLLADWFIRQIGRRNTYFLAMVLFTAGSIIGGTAPTFDQLIIGRIMQGAATGVTQPLAMGTLFAIFPEGRRGRAMGVYGMIIILGPSFGPFIGGITADAIDWRWVFFVPLPFAILAGLLALLILPERNIRDHRSAFDWIGYCLLIVWIPALLIGLTHGRDDGWFSDRIVTLFAIALGGFLTFIAWQFRSSSPLLNLRVFSHARFAAAATVSAMFGAGIFSMMYLVPIFAQVVQGYTPTKAGLLQMPAGLLMAVAMPGIGRLVDRNLGPWLLIGGLSLSVCAGSLMTGASIDTTFWMFAFWLMLNRIGQSMVFTPMSTVSLSSLPPHLVGQGPGIMNFTRSIGSVFGVNIMAVFVESRLETYQEILSDTQNRANPATQEFLEIMRRLFEQAGLPENMQEPASFFYLHQTIHQQANMLAFRDGFMLFTIMMAVAIVPALILSRTRAKPRAAPQPAVQGGPAE